MAGLRLPKAIDIAGPLRGRMRERPRGIGGLVDVKVAAIDETWSGLKFVRRVEDR